MFAKKSGNRQTIMLLFSILSLTSCGRSTIESSPTASISPTLTPIATSLPTIKSIASSDLKVSSSKPHKQDRLNKQALAAVNRQAYDTAIDLFERSLANSDSECHKKYNQAWIKAANKAKSWKATTLSSFALHHMTTTDQKLVKDQKEVFDESFENNLKGYKCDF